MFRSLRISHVEFRFPGSEKLGPGRNNRMERKISGISEKKRTISRGGPKFSKRFSRNFLFHSILNRNFRKFWSNGTRPRIRRTPDIKNGIDCACLRSYIRQILPISPYCPLLYKIVCCLAMARQQKLSWLLTAKRSPDILV